MSVLIQQYDWKIGLWSINHWWNAANGIDAVLDYIALTGNKNLYDLINNTYQLNKDKKDKDFLNEFYDDEGWWAISWLKAYRQTGHEQYLKAAQIIFNDMATTGWDDVCNGGMWWSKKKNYKNAITNELFLKLASQLYETTKNQTYLEWANNEWKWFEATGMINNQSLINDGLVLDTCKNNNGITWTYNQGVVLGGLLALFNATKNQTLLGIANNIARAAIQNLSVDGILTEYNSYNLGNDGPQFKGIFMRNLAELYNITKDEQYANYIKKNAESIWNKDQFNCQIGGMWAGPFDQVDSSRQSAGIDCMNAALAAEKGIAVVTSNALVIGLSVGLGVLVAAVVVVLFILFKKGIICQKGNQLLKDSEVIE